MCDQACLLTTIKTFASNYTKKLTQDEVLDKINLFYRFFSRYTNVEIEEAAQRLIEEGSVNGFPEVSDFKRYLGIVKKYDGESKFCNQCDNTGYYSVWQLKQDIGRWYKFAFRCPCNTQSRLEMPVISREMIPTKPHNPYPPNDNRHGQFNERTL